MSYTRNKDGSAWHRSACRYANPAYPWLYAGEDSAESVWVRLASNGLFGPRWNKPCHYCLRPWHQKWCSEITYWQDL
jgi:hypothetical protein